MDNILQQGIAAAKAGNKIQAFQYLSRATQDGSTAEQGWLWLSSVVDRDEERLFCLDNVLRVNPNNPHARPAAAAFRQKGIFPAAPTPPATTISIPQNSPPTVLSSEPVKMTLQQPVESIPLASDSDGKVRDEMNAYFKYAALELTNNRSSQAIIKELTNRGAHPEVAASVVNETQQLLNKARAEKHKKRMTRGLIWVVLGTVFTCASYAFASELGGSYVLCYGAIILGIFDFLAGLAGWLFSK